jgi:hypothetical protein
MKKEWYKTDRCNIQFDLEQQIMSMWGTKEELELFLEAYMDGPKPMTADEVHNLVYGIACMHDLKSDRAFRTFESLLKAFRTEKEGVGTHTRNEALEEAAKVVETFGLSPIAMPQTESTRDALARQIRKLKVEGDEDS